MPSTDDPLVTTDWLAAHHRRSQGQDHRRVLQDAGRAAAAVGRLSRARIFRARCSSTSMRSPITTIRGRICIRTRSSSRATYRALGISTGDTVVAYDSGGWVAAPRAWWMFLSFGHRNVKVLDGGLKKWLREGRPTHSGKVTPKPGKFQARLDPSYVRSQQQIARQSRNAVPSNWSMRARGRVSKARVVEPRPGRRSGHIPGSRSVPYAELFDAKTGAMKPLDELRQAFMRRRRRHDEADRDDLRLRRLRAGADAGALSARRARHRAL